MEITSSTSIVGLIGHPVAHSLSPRIHSALYQSIDLDLAYLAFDILPGDLADSISGMLALGFKGFNVTIPYKESVLSLIDIVDPYAQQLGAINTVRIGNGRLFGHNTDGEGFIQALKRENMSIKNKSVVIIGAGGAARPIGVYMAKESPERIAIVNRTFEKGKILAHLINDVTGSQIASPVSQIPENMDIIVNTTSLGMWPNIRYNPISGLSLSPETIVCDIVYNPRMTAMLRQAVSSGCQIVDGTGMLIGQALSSVQIWTGKPVKEKYWQIMQEELDKL